MNNPGRCLLIGVCSVWGWDNTFRYKIGNQKDYLHLLLLLTVVLSVTASSYHPVSFLPRSISELRASFSTVTVHNKHPPVYKRGHVVNRSLGSLGRRPSAHGTSNEILHNGVLVATSPVNSAVVEIGRGGHLTPDFSDGLEYPDPFLLTGVAAEAIAKILYSHEMFFGDYPHVSALLRYQQMRRDNGLEGQRLGSINPRSPFYRSRYVYAR